MSDYMHKIYVKTMYLNNLIRFHPSSKKTLVLISFLTLKTLCYRKFFLNKFDPISSIFIDLFLRTKGYLYMGCQA